MLTNCYIAIDYEFIRGERDMATGGVDEEEKGPDKCVT